MSIEDREFGRFESLVLERLDSLKAMGTEIKNCQVSMKARIDKLEHAETRITAIAGTCGALATLLISTLLKYLLK